MRPYRVIDLVSQGALRVEDGNHGNDRPRPDEFEPSGVPFIRAADMSSGTIKFATAGKINSLARSRIRKGIGAPGDVILSHKGTIGKVASAPSDSPEFVCSPQTTFWRSLDESVVNQAYLRYVLTSPGFVRQLNWLKSQTDMAPYVSLTDQRSMTLMLPSAPQQRRIAEVLGALDDKIAANTKLADTITALLAAHFDSLNLHDQSGDVDPISIGELFDLNPATIAPAEAEPVYVDMQKIPTVGPSIGNWDYRPAKGGARFMNGDTLLARITPCLENRKTGYVDFLRDGQIGIGSTEFIVIRSLEGVPGPLSYFFATSPPFRAFAIRHMSGTSGRQRVSALDVAGFPVTRPDEDKLADFGARSEVGFANLKSLTGENRTLAATRDAILPQLMSGKLRVQDVEGAVGNLV